MNRETIMLIVTVLLLIVVPSVLANIYVRYQCESFARISGKEVIYNNWDTCYVNGMRWDEYVAAQTASNALKVDLTHPMLEEPLE